MPILFIAVGDVLVDVLVTGRAHGARVRIEPGGSATRAALAAADAGAEAELVGCVGDDPSGRLLAAELAARGIAASLRVDDVRPTGTFLLVDGEPRVDRGANAGFLPQHLPAGLAADVVLVSGHLQPETVSSALERSEAAWTGLTAARLRELPAGGDALFLDEGEARALTGLDPEPAAQELGRRYRLACVTRGVDGVTAAFDGSVVAVPVPRRVDVARAVGAGDAFAAVTLLALARGEAFRDALEAGCRAGALALSGPK